MTRLRTFMRKVDAVAMSDANVRLLGKRHAKEPQKALVLLHWEFFFMEDVGYELPHFDSEEDVVRYLKSKYTAAGERASCAPMPLNFKENGVYKVLHDDGHWNLQHAFMHKTVEPLDIDDQTGELPVYIEHNHSDRRATIRIRHTTYSRSCEQCFLSSPPGSTTSTSSAPAAAIGDGSTVTLVKKRARMSLLPGQGMLALPQPSPPSLRTARSDNSSALPLPAPSPAKQIEASPSNCSVASASDCPGPAPAPSPSPQESARAISSPAPEPPIDEASFVPDEDASVS